MVAVVPRPLSASFTRFNESSPGQLGVTHPLFAAAAATLPPPRLRLLGYSIAKLSPTPIFFNFPFSFYVLAMESLEQRLRQMSTNGDMTDKLSRAVLWPAAQLARADWKSTNQPLPPRKCCLQGPQ